MKTATKIGLTILSCIFLLGLCQPLYAADNKININTASQEELMKLKYVGEKLSQRIIEYRKDHPFQKTEDLMNVKGIGKKVLSTNKDLIVVNDNQ
jgi:competence protein ComEA